MASRLVTPSLSSLTTYRSVMVYASDGGGQEVLQYMLQPEGLIVPEEGSNGLNWTYKYLKTDHTGSTRVLLAARDGAMEVEQTSDYYPFGLAWDQNNLHLNRYLYSGKQIEDAVLNGSPLALYYFGARYYNPTLARWFNVDPALQCANPYLYCGNSPGMYIDPDGEWFFTTLLTAIFPGVGTVIGGIIDAACWGATISAASYTASVAMSDGGFNNWNWGQFGSAVGWGAVSGMATFGVGQVFGPTGSFLNEAGRGLAHGAVQGSMSAIQGGDFWTGFASGALGSWAGHGAEAAGLLKTTAAQVGFSTLAGGVGSWATGGSFLQGAANGLMVGLLNQAQNKVESAQARRELNNAIEKANAIAEQASNTAEFATELAKVLSPREIALLNRFGYGFTGVGVVTTGAKGYLTYQQYAAGEPWLNSATDTALSGLSLVPALQVPATAVSAYKDAGRWFAYKIIEFNDRGPKWWLKQFTY